MLIRDIALHLRVSSNSLYDTEIKLLMDAAKAELARIGVRAELLEDGQETPLVKHAIILYCKASFGYDNPEAERFLKSFHDIAVALANSDANTSLYEPKAKSVSTQTTTTKDADTDTSHLTDSEVGL